MLVQSSTRALIQQAAAATECVCSECAIRRATGSGPVVFFT